jgi:hypothetical protein
LGHGDNNQCLLPLPLCALEDMKIRPVEIHCGDKFSIIVGVVDVLAGEKERKTTGEIYIVYCNKLIIRLQIKRLKSIPLERLTSYLHFAKLNPS